jgi:hypothetical protein
MSNSRCSFLILLITEAFINCLVFFQNIIALLQSLQEEHCLIHLQIIRL